MSSNKIGATCTNTANHNDETNIPQKLLLTNRQVANFRIVFANNSSDNIKLSKSQISKLMQLDGFFW